MTKEAILDTYSKAAHETRKDLCCGVDYRDEFPAEDLAHIPDEVLERNYGCGIPMELKTLAPGKTVVDLGPGFGRDCFIAARKVGGEGQVFGLDMNEDMLGQARRFQPQVAERLGYDNVQFLQGQFDIEIPLETDSVDVILSNCVNNLATDKETAYREMFRVLRPGSKLSFADIVSYHPLPLKLQKNDQAWADCVAGVLSYQQLSSMLHQSGFHGITLTPLYLWSTGEQLHSNYFDPEDEGPNGLSAEEADEVKEVRLYSVAVEAFKPIVDPEGECYFKSQHAIFHGPGVSMQLDPDPDHVFQVGVLKEVCEKTATILKSDPFKSYFTVFEPQGEVEPRACLPDGSCC
ncbi:MAG: methyltransferase domain-containing protein [Acidobacteriota bacterium]